MTDAQPSPQPSGKPEALARPQRRLLARLFNARSEPVLVEGREFLTFQQAKRYLMSLEGEAREAAYLAMKAQADRDKSTGG